MQMSECEKLSKRFEKMQADGLVDVRFHLRNLDEATPEMVCREVNAIYGALDRGEFVKLDSKDRRKS